MKYICKYTPVELLAGFYIKAELLNPTAENHELSSQHIHSNLCSFSHSLIEERLKNCRDPIIITSCCDSIERTGDVLKSLGQEVYVLNLPHNNSDCCAKLLYQKELLKLIDNLSKTLNKSFDLKSSMTPLIPARKKLRAKYVSVMGARINSDLLNLIKVDRLFL